MVYAGEKRFSWDCLCMKLGPVVGGFEGCMSWQAGIGGGGGGWEASLRQAPWRETRRQIVKE